MSRGACRPLNTHCQEQPRRPLANSSLVTDATRFDGQTVLITGSSRGIGAATARIVRERDGEVVLHGRTETDALHELATELDAQLIVADVADRAAAGRAVQELLDRGPVHALVNAAGMIRPKPFEDLTDEDWIDDYRVNVLGTAHFCQAVLPAMRDAGYGRVVNVSSTRGLEHIAAFRGVPYSSSKAAVRNLTAALAKGYAPHVLVNCVAPGFTVTDMSSTWSPEMWQHAKTALVGRPADAREPAEAIAFLASRAASFITGQTVLVDGGYGASGK